VTGCGLPKSSDPKLRGMDCLAVCCIPTGASALAKFLEQIKAQIGSGSAAPTSPDLSGIVEEKEQVKYKMDGYIKSGRDEVKNEFSRVTSGR
jgi:hypothetical protein